MLNKIEIPKRSQTCAGNGEKIGPGMQYYSSLMVNEASETIRQDYCPACWQDRKEAEGFASKGFWRSKVDAKEPVAAAPRIDQALVLLRSLINQEEGHADEIFMLALYLCHAKKLVLRKEFQEEGSVW
ncbi:MAG: hypothetical protein LW832_07865, partial [Parachlamydia sp.]|nr:hypothetical protein [Parachlamydia sp.]